MGFLNGITLLLLYQLLGEVSVKLLKLPIPGPVLGMLLLFISLLLRKSFLAHVQATSTQLLRHLSLLFVPAGVGVMVHAHTVANQWLPIVVTLVVSTLITMGTIALVVKYSQRHR